MSELRLRRVFAAVLSAGLLQCALATAQAGQTAPSTPPIHLAAGKQVAMPVTVENMCPQTESFSLSTEGLPGGLVRAPQPIAVGANSSSPSKLIVDTTSVGPGLYSGKIVITCVTCGTECTQSQTVFPLQFQIDGGTGGTAAPGETGPSETGPGGAGQGDSGPGEPKKEQPGQTPAGGNAAGGTEKPPGGNGPATPGGNGNTPASPGTGPSAGPGTGGSAPTTGGTGTGSGGTTPVAGGNGPKTPQDGGNAQTPTPAPGMGPDDGLPLPKIPPPGRTRRIATAPCPCEKVCAAAAAAEKRADELLAEYERDETVVQSYQTLIDHIYPYISQVNANLQHYKDTGQPGLAAEEQTTLDGLLKDKENYYKELRAAQESAHASAERYQGAAVMAANARLLCDACLEQHPECPQSIRVPGDTTENPPPTIPPVTGPPTTTAGGGGTTSPPSPPPTIPPTTQEKPKEPIGTTPDDNPNIPKPPELHTPGGGNGYGHEEAAQCPELHHGCIALVADLLKNDVTTKGDKQSRISLEADLKKSEEELKKSKGGGPQWRKDWVKWLKNELQTELPVDLASELKSAGCTVFAPDPELDLQAITYKAPETQADRDRIISHNDDELGRLKQTVKDFRTAVEAIKPEVAIVLVDAHGGSAIPMMTADRCGDWGAGFNIGYVLKNDDILYRADFHIGNYAAVNKNVCGWFNIDLSCYGGLTPKVTDELENYSTSTCQKSSTIACGLHAGWSGDGGFSSATAVTSCRYGVAYNNANRVRQMIDNHLANAAAAGGATPAAGGAAPDFQWLIDGLKKIERGGTAYYSDRGYHDDPPTPVHGHYGYPSTAAAPACTGGKCGN